MVEQRLREKVEHRPGRPGLRLGRAENDAIQACLQDRARAHGARFQRHVEGATVEPVVAERQGAGTQCANLGMRGRVVQGHRRVVSGGDPYAVLHQHRADRHLPALACGTGLGQREAHPVGIGRHWSSEDEDEDAEGRGRCMACSSWRW